MTRHIDGPIPRLPHFQAWLAAQGGSQTQIADRIGVTPRAVSYWQLRQRWPTVEALRSAPEGLRALADDLEGIHGYR